jgi:asparagine synthase (glutamine-hydrolysing)
LEVSPVINHDFAQRVDLMDRLEAFQQKPIVMRTTREAHYRSLSSGRFPLYLETFDKAAAVFSLEPRYPFFDKRLVEFCLALPSEQKFAQGWPRRIHRRGMEAVLPTEIAWRPDKTSLSASFRWGMLNADRGLLDRVFFGDPGILAEYVNISALRETYQRYVAAQGTSADGHTAWRAVMLGLWLGQTGMTP